MRLFGRKKQEFNPIKADDLVLDQLRELGTDLTKPRDARFYLSERTSVARPSIS